MALWTDSTKYLWTGRTGLQYRTRISCTRSQEDSKRLVIDFYSASGATANAGEREGMLAFTRGSRWKSRLSWIFPFSEKWPEQDIVVEYGADVVEVSYDVRIGCCMVFSPNALVAEAAELERLLLGPQ
jgi:hypothetical protein